MRKLALTILTLSVLLASYCSWSTNSNTEGDSDSLVHSKVVVPLEIDGTRIFVPKRWAWTGLGEPSRPQNILYAGTGGWGQFETRVGPLGAVGDHDWPLDGIFRAKSVGQPVDDRDPFFSLPITFSFPFPPSKRNWWGGVQVQQPYHHTLDVLDISYRAPQEKPMQYRALLSNLRPGDGDAIGDGWRVVTRTYEKQTLYLRFDEIDWRSRNSSLPRRIAVSYRSDTKGIWDHHVQYDPVGWVADFKTINLPLSHWRAKHETAETVFHWLQMAPQKRDRNKRFEWWQDIKDRPLR